MKRLLRPFLPFRAFERPQWQLVSVMWAAGLIQGFAMAHSVNTLPFARVAFRLTEGEMGFLLGLTRIGALLALWYALRSDRGGRRRPYVMAWATMIIGTGLTAVAWNPASYVVAQSVARMGGTAAGVLAVVILTEGLVRGNRAYGIGILAAGASLGAGISLFALPIAQIGPQAWRILFAITFLGIFVVPPLGRAVPESPLFERPLDGAPWYAAAVGRYSGRFWTLALMGFLAAGFTAVALSFNTERLIDDLGFEPYKAAMVLLAGGTIGGLGFFAGGRLADRRGRRTTAATALILAMAGGLGVYWLENPWLLVGAAAVSGFGSFAAAPSIGALRNELFPTDLRSVATLWLNNFGVAGAITALLLGPVTIDQIGLQQTVTVLAVGMVIASGLVLSLPETRGQMETATSYGFATTGPIEASQPN